MFYIRAYFEPKSYKEACVHPNWVNAMKDELTALEKTHTRELTSNGCIRKVKSLLISNGCIRLKLNPMVLWSVTKDQGLKYRLAC